jgi:hypothetical protein
MVPAGAQEQQPERFVLVRRGANPRGPSSALAGGSAERNPGLPGSAAGLFPRGEDVLADRTPLIGRDHPDRPLLALSVLLEGAIASREDARRGVARWHVPLAEKAVGLRTYPGGVLHAVQRIAMPWALGVVNPQPALPEHRAMDDDIDNAIETAARHAREAEKDLIETPVNSPEIIVEAHVVQRRVEDLNELAEDAARETGQE